MDDAHHLHDTTDAAAWAKEFCKRWPSALCQIPGKDGVSGGDDFEAIMVGWFANAIMAGVDSEARGSAARIRALEAENARLQMLLAARGRLDAGEPSNSPTTGRAATPLVPDWRTMSTKAEDGYNG